MGKYHHHLTLPFAIDMEAKVRSLVTPSERPIQINKVAKGDIDARLIALLNEAGIYVPNALIFTVKTKSLLPAHSDRAGAKLNISYGAPGSRMFWWKSNVEPMYFKSVIGTDYWQVPQSSCKFLESARIGLTLVDSDTIHSVVNNTDTDRITLNINLRYENLKTIPFSVAETLLSKYIK